MTSDEMKVIVSVYQLWLIEKKDELVDDFYGAPHAEPKRKTVEKKPGSKHAMATLAYNFAF
jgi:hypothetical protein